MTRKRMLIAVGLLCAFAVGIGLFHVKPWGRFRRKVADAQQEDDSSCAAPAQGFAGSSQDLRRTVIVPTLDTPLPAGKNAIWCGSFQLAWNRLAEDILHAPPDVANAEEVVARLNSAAFKQEDVPEGSCYAAAGFTNEGIVEQVRTEMQRRFKKEPWIDLGALGDGVLQFAYLQARVRFTIPFFDNKHEFLFHETAGEGVPVSSFGIRPGDEEAYFELRHQVAVLHVTYHRPSDGESPRRMKEFIIDPCRDSAPSQLLLALVEPKETLAATWKDVAARIQSRPATEDERWFGDFGILLVPNLDWDIAHRFTELEGLDKVFRNPGFESYYIDAAIQVIRFKLDRSGAELESEAAMHDKSKDEPRNFVFSRPFLIAMRQRGRDEPFFVMWVANSELLLRAEAAQSKGAESKRSPSRAQP